MKGDVLMRRTVLALSMSLFTPVLATEPVPQETNDRKTARGALLVTVTVRPSCRIRRDQPDARPEAKCSHEEAPKVKERIDAENPKIHITTFEF